MKTAGYLFFVGIFLTSWYGQAKAANILYMALTPSPSHTIWDKTIAMALRQRGHHITFVSHANEKSMPNFTTILIEGVYDKMLSSFDYAGFITLGPIDTMLEIYKWFSIACEASVNTNGVKQLMKQAQNNVRYDLILFDMTCGHCFYPFIEKFNFPPVVGTSPFGLQYYFTSSFGITSDASYSPLFGLPYTDQMTFFQRFHNYFYTMLHQFWHYSVYMPAQWKLAEELFGSDIVHYHKIEKNVSFVLVNYDANLDYPRSLPPAIIPVGGLHTRREKTLPQDISNYLENAKHGVILFSLGTNVRSDEMEVSKRDNLIKAFSHLKQIILWKFESHIDNLPKNVIVRPWLPQNDILAHHNVKLFISHGGGLSTQEAMYHGMPIVGIPFFADQHVNMHKIINRKVGLKLDYFTLTTKIALDTINEVLNNPIYKKNAEKISERYRDQPQDALTRAIFWIEYAVRHGGAQHLRVAPRDMSVYQLYYLDIWAFIIAVAVIMYLVIRKSCSVFFKADKIVKLKSS